MRALVVVLSMFALSLTLSEGVAGAQANKQQAEQHFNAGQKAYTGGQYDVAVKEFLQAYTLVPVNPLLFNIGQAYRLSGDKEKALSYYEKYVAFEPGGAQVADAKGYIATLKIEVETRRREQEQAEAEKAAKDAEAQRQLDEENRKKAAAELARRKAEAQSAGSGLRTAGLVVGGLGVVALGAGIGLGVAKTFDGKAIGLTAGGAALAVTGGVLYYLGVKQRNDAVDKISLVVPHVTGSSFGVTWITTF